MLQMTFGILKYDLNSYTDIRTECNADFSLLDEQKDSFKGMSEYVHTFCITWIWIWNMQDFINTCKGKKKLHHQSQCLSLWGLKQEHDVMFSWFMDKSICCESSALLFSVFVLQAFITPHSLLLSLPDTGAKQPSKRASTYFKTC